MIKKKLIAATAAVTALSIALTACGAKDTNNAKETSQTSTKTESTASASEKPKENLIPSFSDEEAKKYVKLGDYKNLDIDYTEPVIEDGELENYINQILLYYPERTPVDRAVAEKGDTVEVAYTVSIKDLSDEEFTPYSTQGDFFCIGAGIMDEDFENGLIGMKIGETKDINVKLPDDYYNTTTAGHTMTYTTTLLNIYDEKTHTVDTITDDYIKNCFKDVYNVETADAFKKAMKENLIKSKDSTNVIDVKYQIMDLLLDICEFSYPDELLQKSVDDMTENYLQMAQQSGFETAEEYLIASYGVKDEAGAKEFIRKEAKTNLESIMVVDAIAEDMGITVTDEDVRSFAEETAAENGMTYEELMESVVYTNEDIKEMCREEKVIDKIIEAIKNKK